mmetsp:Transcript_8315/g.17283  ORF Transcript_8315/g.17283 Transcript_8315/m.17283 type:complete len:184 (+) Transcript_8315:1-552(+)
MNLFPESPPLTPLFVTWEKKKQLLGHGSDSNGNDDVQWNLRGCIGTLQPADLRVSLKQYALHSALQDRRFKPITLDELPMLRVGVSLLIQFEECEKGCYDWEVGRHGIIIEFANGGRNYNATYLPEVASEHGMTKEVAVESLVRKAGYRGKVDAKLLSSIKTTRYQSSKAKVTHDEWRATALA